MIESIWGPRGRGLFDLQSVDLSFDEPEVVVELNRATRKRSRNECGYHGFPIFLGTSGHFGGEVVVRDGPLKPLPNGLVAAHFLVFALIEDGGCWREAR